MGLFTKTNRPTVDAITARIDELKARHDSIAAEITAAEEKLAAALATGNGADAARKVLTELRDEADALPKSIELLESERVEILRENFAAQVAEWEDDRDRVADAARRAYADVLKAIEKYNTKVAELTTTAPGHFSNKPTDRLHMKVPNDPTVAFIDDVNRGIAQQKLMSRV